MQSKKRWQRVRQIRCRRGTFPGFTYHFGNFLAAGGTTIQVMFAAKLRELWDRYRLAGRRSHD
jgi:hypothetical protein